MKESIRAQETKEKFQQAFFRLYETRKIEAITIKEITDMAGFNRGTFYLYYKNIYDLMQQTEKEILDNFKTRIEANISAFFGDETFNPAAMDDGLQEKYMNITKILNGENGDPRFRHKMKNIVKDAFRKHLKMEHHKQSSKFEYLLEYFIEANMSLFYYWRCIGDKNTQQQVTLKDIHDIMRFVAKNGWHKAFEEFKNQ